MVERQEVTSQQPLVGPFFEHNWTGCRQEYISILFPLGNPLSVLYFEMKERN